LRELAKLLANLDEPPFSIELEAPAEDVRSGYARWAGSYDVPKNPLIHAEQPVVHSLVDSLPPGRALDAACGTGRHLRHLREPGHHALPLPPTPQMLHL